MDYIPFLVNWVAFGVPAGISLIFVAMFTWGALGKHSGNNGAILSAIGFPLAVLCLAISAFSLFPSAHQAQVAEEMTEYYGIELDSSAIKELGYPAEKPRGDSLAYGTTVVGDRKLTLIWKDEEMLLGEKKSDGKGYDFLEPKP